MLSIMPLGRALVHLNVRRLECTTARASKEKVGLNRASCLVFVVYFGARKLKLNPLSKKSLPADNLQIPYRCTHTSAFTS